MISAPLIEYLKKGIFTLLGLILAVYLFVILSTYTGNDPSWSHISSDMTTVNNMGGEMGAWLSDLLYSFFGFGAWWLLAFLVYESILIWWDNKPTFWLLRLVAYVFLILSASALFAQLVALVQQVTKPAATSLEGVAGGIIGLELQARLAQLLTQWGSVTFLTVFVIVTATFAFNIHWLTIYRKLTARAWFGDGVRSKDNTTQAVQKDNVSLPSTDDAPTIDDEHLADQNESQNDASYGQLPLELPSTHDASSSHFEHTLTDFLTNSGIGASVKASIAAAKEAATNISDRTDSLQPVTAMPDSAATHTHATAAPSQVATTTLRKIEPSFTWNDANTVDDLLANERSAEQNISYPNPDVPMSSQPSKAVVSTLTETEVVHPTSNRDEDIVLQSIDDKATAIIVATDHPATEAKTIATTVNTNVEALPVEQMPVSLVDEREKVTFLAEQPVPAVEPSIETSNELSTESAKSSTESELSAIPKAPYVSEVAPVAVSVPETTSLATNSSDSDSYTSLLSAVADMTPTNTPPDNPTVPPTVAPNLTASAQPSAPIEPVAATKPTVSFAVPEGDSSNHITEMMPDDDVSVPVMPDIHDDAAFSQRSRAMQTAEYRGSLTPIPEVSILDKPDPDRQPSYTIAELEQLSELLEIKLQEFNVKAAVVNAIPGPVVTRFEVELAAGVKASKVTGISRDLARSLSMASLRVVEVIPGKPYIGIEVPNKQREMVRLIELLDTEKFNDPKAQISMAMGKDIGGNPIITDLARAPHMLVAGTTGSGKSVLVNAMLLSMLLKYTPNELRLILIDPKQLELANYNDIPHLLTPVVTDMTEAASSLSWCVAEMERRYQLMSLLKVRKLNEFNKKVIAAEQAGQPMLDPLWRPNDNVSISQAPKLKTLPMIVIVADEFADMIMQVGKQAEELITRLAQKSRAAGIHLMLATQRPSVDVITGLIKANIPVRAALRVNSKVDSRTILDSGGAEDMLGNGDMLFLGPGQIEPDRVHGAYVSDEEVNRVCDAWRERGAPDYIDNMAGNFELSSSGSGGSSGNASGEDDDLYNDAVAFIMETRKVSASSIQRKFSIGYNRAARIVDSMEEAGLVSSMGKSGKRELLM